MPLHIDLLYVTALLSASQNSSWGFIKKYVPKVDQARCSYCPLNTVSQGILQCPWADTFRLELEHSAFCRIMTQLCSDRGDDPGYTVVTMRKDETLLTFSLCSAFLSAGEDPASEISAILWDGSSQ